MNTKNQHSETEDTEGNTGKKCGRCKEIKNEFTTDPRWKTVCLECHKELIEKHGSTKPSHYSKETTTPRERGDGQPVGSPPPETL